MTTADLLPTLRDLTRADKLRVMQFLVGELAKEEEIDLTTLSNYPIWSPHMAFDAADRLLAALAADKSNRE